MLGSDVPTIQGTSEKEPHNFGQSSRSGFLFTMLFWFRICVEKELYSQYIAQDLLQYMTYKGKDYSTVSNIYWTYMNV